MNYRMLSHVLSLTLVVLFLVACGAPAATPKTTLAPPTETPTSVQAIVAPTIERMKQDLYGQDVVFSEPFAFFGVGDSMVLGKENIDVVEVIDSVQDGQVLTVRVKIRFVGMVIGDDKQMLLATGGLRYEIEEGEYRFLDFVSTSAGEQLKE